MARKQKAKGFNKFLDFIGLVDAAPEEEFDNEFDFNSGRSKNRGTVRNDNLDDEFAEEPRMTRAPRRERSQAGSQAAANNRFDADEGWDTGSSRPDYSSERGSRMQRPQQTAQSRGGSRYGDSQRFGGTQNRSGSRYEQNENEGSSGYRSASSYGSGASSYGAGSFGGGQFRAGSTASYGSSGRRVETDFGMDFQRDAQRGQAGGWQRHQTVIFKLHSVDECKDVILALIEKKSVLLNLDELDSLQAQRTLDTMSGATFAIGATLSRASDRTWLITPSTVEVADSQMDNGSRYGSRHYM